MRVRVVIEKVIRHRLNYLPRNLRTAGPVEIGDRKAVMKAIQGREMRADFFARSGFVLCHRNCLITNADQKPAHIFEFNERLSPAVSKLFRADCAIKTTEARFRGKPLRAYGFRFRPRRRTAGRNEPRRIQ